MSNASTTPVSKGQLWTGRIMSALPALFLLFGSIMGMVNPKMSAEGMAQMGYPKSVGLPLGITLLTCTILYLIPRTAVFGALLLTGYLGGAVATHVRVEDPFFSKTLFPVYFAVLLWGGLWLRDTRLRALLPFRRD